MRWLSRDTEIRSLLVGLLILQQTACGGASKHSVRSDAAGGEGGATGAATIEGCDFEDALVGRAVMQALGGSPDAAKVAGLESLTAHGASSLAGIECLTNLEALVSTDGTLTDVSPLARLPRLQRVQIARNRVADLSPLSANLALEQLKAASNRVQTLDGLTLPALRPCSELILEFNPLAAADVAFACDAGWPVTWGGTTARDIQRCNAPCLK